MKKIRYRSIPQGIREIKRIYGDDVRVAIYINEEDELYCDLQIEYGEQCINISSYELEKGSMEFWEFYEVASKKMKKEAEKLENELKKYGYEVERLTYTC